MPDIQAVARQQEVLQPAVSYAVPSVCGRTGEIRAWLQSDGHPVRAWPHPECLGGRLRGQDAGPPQRVVSEHRRGRESRASSRRAGAGGRDAGVPGLGSTGLQSEKGGHHRMAVVCVSAADVHTASWYGSAGSSSTEPAIQPGMTPEDAYDWYPLQERVGILEPADPARSILTSRRRPRSPSSANRTNSPSSSRRRLSRRSTVSRRVSCTSASTLPPGLLPHVADQPWTSPASE